MQPGSPQQNTILVVDDSEMNRALLRAVLTQAGYAVEERENGAECVEYCKQTSPAMVLLDIMMPEMDGLEACKKLRGLYSKEELPVIMVTTLDAGDDVAAGLAAGANDYVIKPIERPSLLARIELQFSALESRRELDLQRRSAERALKIQSAMGDVLPDAVVIHEKNGLVLYSNDPLTEACGGQSPENINEVFSNIYGGELKGEHLRELVALLDNDDGSYDREFVITSAQPRYIRVLSRPVILEDGPMLRVWFWRDMTPLRLLEEKTREQVKVAAVGVFSAGVAHNFNNLLGTILGAAEILARQVQGGEKEARCLDIIRQSVQEGKGLTESVVGFMKGQSRVGSPDGSVELVPLLKGVLESEIAGSEKSITYTVPNESYRLRMFEEHQRLLFENVVSNAVDSIDESGEIHITCEGNGDGLLRIIVNDSGRGMKAEEVSRVTEPFFTTKNLDETNKVSYQGNGLGMWNVYNLVKFGGGELEIRSTPSQGTRVIITLPTALEEVAQVEGTVLEE